VCHRRYGATVDPWGSPCGGATPCPRCPWDSTVQCEAVDRVPPTVRCHRGPMGVPMRRRHPLSSLPVWLVAFTARQAGAKPGSRLNILMLASDDMRPEIASPYGVPFMRTQNISRLAQQGTTFRYAYCQVAVCAPSRTALLTGTRNDWTRVWTIGPYFRRSMGAHADPKIFKTLPQMFKEHGYNVTGAGKIFHGGGPSGGQGCCGGYDMPYSWTEPYWDCDQFWNQTVQSPRSAFWPLGAGNTALDSPPFYTFVKSGTGCAQSDSCVACLVAHSRGWGTDVSWASAPCDDTCFPDGLVAQRTLEALRYKAAHRDQPFFLAAGFKRPHLGFYAPQWAYDLYPNESIVLAKHRTPPRDMPQPAFCPYGSMRVFEDTNKGGIFQPSPPLSSPAANGTFTVPLLPDWKHYELRRGYQAAVSFVDAQVGKLLDALEQLELRSTTAVVMWGDHGFQLGEHGEWGKFTNWELGTVSRPFPSWDRSILTEIYLCHACTYHETEDGNGPDRGYP
jgi:iduronate 2-sulfatase